MDYEELAAAVEEMREAFRAFVAGLIEDGFTEEQARALVVGIYVGKGGDDE